MVTKVRLFSIARGVQPALDIDQIGLQMWGMGVLVICLSLAMRLNSQSDMLYLIVRGALLIYAVGLLLIALGMFHVLRMHMVSAKNGQRTYSRYARSALLPLWYYTYAAPSAGARARPHRWALLRFDHGQAWAWGVECLILAGIVETALMLAAQHPLWHNIGTLVVLAVVRVMLRGLRERVSAHGHREIAR